MGRRAHKSEFQQLDLRCHSLLADVPLHDVWAIELPGGEPDRTMLDVRRAAPLTIESPGGAVRALLALRSALGAAFGWDRARGEWSAESYVRRLSDDDRARSLIAPGTREGRFTTLYVFSHESLAEIRNATVHAFVSMALVACARDYVLYLAIYVKPVGAITAVYMALIDPFRRVVVYPALVRNAEAAWARAVVR